MDRRVNAVWKKRRMVGGGKRVRRGVIMQRGQGLFSMLGRIIPYASRMVRQAMPTLIPAVKEAAVDLGKVAINTGLEAASDAIRGEDPKVKLKKRAREVQAEVADRIDSVRIMQKKKRKKKRDYESESSSSEEDGEEEIVMSKKKKKKKAAKKTKKSKKKKKKKFFSG